MAILNRALTIGAALLALGATPAFAETLFEVEHARGIARSGGPVSEHDAEILNRWGATTGSRGWRQRRGETVELYIDERPRRRVYRRYYRD